MCVRVCVSLADRLQFDPGVGPADLHGQIVGKDVVTELVQWWLRVRDGKLGCVLDYLPDVYIYLLYEERKDRKKEARRETI